MFALMYYAPSDFGFTLSQGAHGRTFSSPDMTLVESKLNDGSVSNGLSTIVQTLRTLLDYLPRV